MATARQADLAIRAALPTLLLLAGCGETRAPIGVPPTPLIPGQWEIRSAVTGARAPRLPVVMRDRLVGPRPTRRVCVTPAQAASPDAGFLAQRPGSCAQRGVRLDGGRLTGAMVCRQQGLPPDVISLDGRYGPDRYVLRMAMTSPLPDGTVITLDVVTVGERIGDCEGGRG